MEHPSERRRFLRSVFNAPVRLVLPAGQAQARLLDVSLKGALVEVGHNWGGQVGQACRIHLDLAPGVAIQMTATVMHIVDGVRVGLHTEHIDLDSLTHLRQLIEHNAEDPSLLERDLGKLMQSS